jgi:hypothetical protein
MYLLNGEFVGKGVWQLTNMSERWLTICRDALRHYGPIFKHRMSGPLSRFEMQFTAGLAHFRCNDVLVLSAVYLPGTTRAADEGALSVFTQQVLNSRLFKAASPDPTAFASHLATHAERPLAVSVLWGPSQIDEDDQSALIELDHHLAAEYLCRYTVADAA